ncbi:MAG: hypothetical protein M1565_00845 [Actinobacteria bacterium]|nr:hypothetical protein [Actinomycetota bacterium]MCL5736121.1 hypothetical protein [Actinomycetota bacterium]
MEGLTEGRIVHYVLEDGPNAGHDRAAMIVKVWNRETGCCNLLVFLDGTNDGHKIEYQAGGTIAPLLWKTSRLYSAEEGARGTWHWPERETIEASA